MEYEYGQNQSGQNPNEQSQTGQNASEQHTYNYYETGATNQAPYYTQQMQGQNPIPDGGGKKPKKEKKSSHAGLIVACICASLFAGLLGGAGGAFAVSRLMGHEQKAQVQLGRIPDKTPENKLGEDLSGYNNEKEGDVQDKVEEQGEEIISPVFDSKGQYSVAQIAKIGLPSVVAITNKGETEIRSIWGNFTQESESAGSGVIIGQTDTELLIVTNYHVVENNNKLNVIFSYEEDEEEPDIIDARVKDFDEARDIAVIALKMEDLSEENLQNIQVAQIGNSNNLVLGEQVVAIGNALGYGQSVTTGVVSALSRTVDIPNSAYTQMISNEYLQTDAAINPGNSGGALFNMEGELVGINAAKVSSQTVDSVGYSIPISLVVEEIQSMMNTETRSEVADAEKGYLGITGSTVSSDISKQYSIPQGAYISGITEGTGAEAAGLQKGMVITALNNKAILSMNDLISYLGYYKAGETVDLTVQVMSENGYVEKHFDVVLSDGKTAGITNDDIGQSPDAADEEAADEQESGEDDTETNPYQGQFGPYDWDDFFGGFFGGGF